MATIQIDFEDDIILRDLRTAENALQELSHGKQVPLPKKPLEAFVVLIMTYLKVVERTTGIQGNVNANTVLGNGRRIVQLSKNYRTTPLYPCSYLEMKNAFLDFITLEPCIFAEIETIIKRNESWIDKPEPPEPIEEGESDAPDNRIRIQ